MTKARVGRLISVAHAEKEAGARVHESLLLQLTFAIELGTYINCA